MKVIKLSTLIILEFQVQKLTNIHFLLSKFIILLKPVSKKCNYYFL